MAAATGDFKWEGRYLGLEPQLDAAIKEATLLAPEIFISEAAIQTDRANRKLVAMEKEAFTLLRQGDRDRAVSLLSSGKYEEQKEVYTEGMGNLTGALKERGKEALRTQSRRAFSAVASVLIFLPIFVSSWLGVLRLVRKHNFERERIEDELREAKDELEVKVEERTEKLKRKNEEMENFIYSISHDLKTPVRAIQGLSQALSRDLEKQLKGEHLEDLSALRRTAESTDRLLGDMLTYARLGFEDFSKSEAPLKTVILDAQLELIDVIKTSGAKIHIVEPMPVIAGHERTLVRLMVNLLGNAIKFVQPGQSPEIHIEAVEIENRMRISVRDNGIGIDPRFQEKIFGMFARLHSQHDYGGTGIGLAIAQKAVELHGGRIGAESRLGEGSVFWFEIPDQRTI